MSILEGRQRRMLYDKEKEFIELDYFGIVERFSVFAATGYNAVLGIELYRMKF